jgi:nuclear autoantigenic sperm protein
MVSTSDVAVNEVPAVDGQTIAATKEIISINEEEFEKAQKTFQLGKKNLFLNKYDESVNNIGDACKIYSAKYGEFDSQCAEIYFFYGRALLELARVENTVLGNALNGVPEDTGPINDSRYGNPEDVAADEKKEISDKVIDALCDNNDSVVEKKEDEAKPMEGTEETKTTEAVAEPALADAPATETVTAEAVTTEEKKVETATANGETTETPKVEGEAAGEEEGGDEEVEGEDEEDDEEDLTKNDEQVKDEAENEEISSLQRSWEMFELAKLVYQKNFADDLAFKNKRIAECLLKLGEISIEQEMYEQAITDIGESIKLQEAEEKEQRDERMLAESFYQWALAQQFNNQFTDAAESFQKSINIIQLRVEKLKGKLAGTWPEGDADAELEKNTIKEEIADMEALMPEMTGKLEEVSAQDAQSLSLIKEAKECFANNLTNGATPTNGTAVETNGEVKDITSLVKSKRKLGACDEDETSVKKTRLSDAPATEEVAASEAVVEKMEGETTTESTATTTTAAATTEEAPVATETVAITTETVAPEVTA